MTLGFFESRTQVGQLLAKRLAELNLQKPVVLALPRGGVPVAAEIARQLRAPLDLLFVRKIGVPWQKELAAAAVVDGEQHDLVYNDEVMFLTGLDKSDLKLPITSELAEIERRRKTYLKDQQPVSVEGCTVIVVDDGIATGTTARVAVQALRRRGPAKIILAIGVAPPDTISKLSEDVDDIICLLQPEPFVAIGNFYSDFHQVSDSEVIEILDSARQANKTGS